MKVGKKEEIKQFGYRVTLKKRRINLEIYICAIPILNSHEYLDLRVPEENLQMTFSMFTQNHRLTK